MTYHTMMIVVVALLMIVQSQASPTHNTHVRGRPELCGELFLAAYQLIGK